MIMMVLLRKLHVKWLIYMELMVSMGESMEIV